MKYITGLEIASHPKALLESLERYEAQGSVPTRRDIREERLMEEVALDLALSMDIFSAVPLITHPPRSEDLLNDDELERATQALSIVNDDLGKAPPVRFNFLRPRYPITKPFCQGVEGDMDGSGTVDLCLGVRQLLADWKLGHDPNQFIFRNPYEEHEPTTWKKRRKAIGKKLERDEVKAQTRSHIPIIMASSQMPPMISTQGVMGRECMPPHGVASRMYDGGLNRPRVRSGFGFETTQAGSVSQPLDFASQEGLFGASSQTWLGPSTQVLPGPHGGRPEANVAKKKQKKRAGGF